ncbi:MAG TPA: DMT family transporter [Candidatus Limnocylindria bacterium]|nr:DMT family transporter [Candidatus Limnocylindria bacterium]
MPASLLTPLTYLVVALAWSGGWIVGKLGVTAVPPLEFVAVRYAIAALVLLAVVRAMRIPLRGAPFGATVVAALFGYVGYNSLAFTGLTMAPASDAALIGPPSLPILTALGATLVGERITRTKVAGFALASLGATLVIVSGAREDGVMDARRLTGDLLLLAAAMCWAAHTVVASVALRDRPPLAVVTLGTLISAPVLVLLGWLENGYRDLGGWSAGVWAAVGYQVLVLSVLSFILFFYAVRRYGPGSAAMVSYLVPLGTLALAAIFLGERPAPLQLLGGAIVLAGVRVATLRRRVEPLEEVAAA